MADITDPLVTAKLTAAVAEVAPITGCAMSLTRMTPFDVTNATVYPVRYVRVDYTADAAAEEIEAGDHVARTFNLAEPPRRRRPLYAIHKDVSGLANDEISAISADLFGGDPPKVALDEGPNAPDLLTLRILRNSPGMPPAVKRECDMAAIAIYTQDNPNYLVNPPFAPNVNVPGDAPIAP